VTSEFVSVCIRSESIPNTMLVWSRIVGPATTYKTGWACRGGRPTLQCLSCACIFPGPYCTGNRKAAVSLLVAVRQTSRSQHRCLFAVSFLGGSRQTCNTLRQASMSWAGWLGSRQLENTRRGPLCVVSPLTGLTTHTTHTTRAALSREQTAMAHDTDNTH
jgi:hypothetical protein